MKRELSDVYLGLREQIFDLSPEKIGISVPENQPIAVLMETGYPESIVTLVCVADGSTSLYFSNGGGIIGAGEHEAVRAASQSFLASASDFIHKMERSKQFPIPEEGSVRFYVVTTKGIFSVKASEDDLGVMRHELSQLFQNGHHVISAIRENSPQ